VAPRTLPCLIGLAGAVLAAPAGTARGVDPVWSYDVTAGPGGRELSVEAQFTDGVTELTLDDGLGPFVQQAEWEQGPSWIAAERVGDRLSVPGCARGPCRVRYRFLLERAATEVHDRNRAVAQAGALLAPPSSWLARPLRNTPGRYRLRVSTPPGTSFVTGVFPGPEAGTYEAETSDLAEAPYSGFGSFDESRVEVTGGAVDVAVAPGELGVTRADIDDWVRRAAGAVAGYYGRFPLRRALVIVLPSTRGRIGFGTTLGNGGGAIMIWVGRGATKAQFAGDWVLTHEMVHLGIPNLPRTHRWLEEGIATYVEPLARVRAGTLDAGEMWAGLVKGLPNGLPQPGDRGLDRTHTWGRTYWGGALFCFLADLEIRERTRNRRSLDDALRGILAAGGDIAVSWPLERLLREGDRATGVPVLSELHARMGAKAEDVDLPALWQRLGVRTAAEPISFADSAPLAAIRRSMAPGSERAP
jgi:predicted metalloprotease with PDZ domain